MDGGLVSDSTWALELAAIDRMPFATATHLARSRTADRRMRKAQAAAGMRVVGKEGGWVVVEEETVQGRWDAAPARAVMAALTEKDVW